MRLQRGMFPIKIKKMELITFDHLDSEASILEYKLNNKTTAHNLTNVAEHISDI